MNVRWPNKKTYSVATSRISFNSCNNIIVEPITVPGFTRSKPRRRLNKLPTKQTSEDCAERRFIHTIPSLARQQFAYVCNKEEPFSLYNRHRLPFRATEARKNLSLYTRHRLPFRATGLLDYLTTLSAAFIQRIDPDTVLLFRQQQIVEDHRLENQKIL